MTTRFIHTCLRVVDPQASARFYAALGFTPAGQLNFDSAYNVYLGLAGSGDVLELTVNVGRAATSRSRSTTSTRRSRRWTTSWAWSRSGRRTGLATVTIYR
jgi:catechol 2,3-dioxygenase-like lactoylglutathione lyase family enzyme